LDIVRAKVEHDPDIYKSVSSSFGNKSMTSVDQHFAEIAILFRPDGYAFKDAVKSKKRRENQPAVDFMEEVEKLGYKYWVGVPDGVDVFSDIIDNMSSQHHPVMKNQLSIALNALSRSTDPNPITFQNLKRWAAHSDSEFAKRKAKKTDKLAQAAAAEFDGAGGRGRGRDPNFRGRGRDGQYRGRVRTQANFSQLGFAEFLPRAFTAELLPFDPEVLPDSEPLQPDSPARNSTFSYAPAAHLHSSSVPFASGNPVHRAPAGTFQEYHIRNSVARPYVPSPRVRNVFRPVYPTPARGSWSRSNPVPSNHVFSHRKKERITSVQPRGHDKMQTDKPTLFEAPKSLIIPH
jgi:hypothetical protein